VHLEEGDHGEIWHYVLTQPVRATEAVGAARVRFEGAWKKWYRVLRKCGMKSALLTEHVKPRESYGWHFHGHCVVEWKAGVDSEKVGERLERAWQRGCKEESGREKGLFRRLVCGAGGAIGEGGLSRQGEFWSESVSAVQRVLQYAIRDVVQGCESWVVGLKEKQVVGEFAAVVSDAKLHRLFGVWRKKGASECVTQNTEAVAVDGVGKKSGKVEDGLVWHQVGTMESVWEGSRSGSVVMREILSRLCVKYCNRGLLYRRLLSAVTCVSGARRAG
jgi:hypothetical protein